jgi:hypothetical protein
VATEPATPVAVTSQARARAHLYARVASIGLLLFPVVLALVTP